MEAYKIIREFFMSVKCNKCKRFFTENSLELVRQESNTVVVRVTCDNCKQSLGLAILGIERSNNKNSLSFEPANFNEKIEENYIVNEPITYDEVIEAHKFFSGLGNDWSKYLPKTE